MSLPRACPDPLDETAVPTQSEFRNAMSRLAAAVHVVTTDGPMGRFGFTASAICSVTDTPPTLLVCVNKNASALAALLEHRVLCVNTLSPTQQALSGMFGGGAPMEDRFAAARWDTAPSGAPRLCGALMSLDCRIASIADEGTHKVLFCRVHDIRKSEGSEALVYFGRSYHGVGERGLAASG